MPVISSLLVPPSSLLRELLPLPGPRRTVRTARGTGARPADGEAPNVDGSAPDRGEPTAEGTR